MMAAAIADAAAPLSGPLQFSSSSRSFTAPGGEKVNEPIELFTTTRPLRIATLGGRAVKLIAPIPQSKSGYFQHFPWRGMVRCVELEGVAERFIFLPEVPPTGGSISASNIGPSYMGAGTQQWFQGFALPCQHVWSLLETAFASDNLAVTASGWVHVVSQSEAEVTATILHIASRIAAGEQVAIPALKVERVFIVSELTVVRVEGSACRKCGSAGPAGES